MSRPARKTSSRDVAQVEAAVGIDGDAAFRYMCDVSTWAQWRAPIAVPPRSRVLEEGTTWVEQRDAPFLGRVLGVRAPSRFAIAWQGPGIQADVEWRVTPVAQGARIVQKIRVRSLTLRGRFEGRRQRFLRDQEACLQRLRARLEAMA